MTVFFLFFFFAHTGECLDRIGLDSNELDLVHPSKSNSSIHSNTVNQESKAASQLKTRSPEYQKPIAGCV